MRCATRGVLTVAVLGIAASLGGCGHRHGPSGPPNVDDLAWTKDKPEASQDAFVQLVLHTPGFWAPDANGQDVTLSTNGLNTEMQIVSQATSDAFYPESDPPDGKAGRLLFRLINKGPNRYLWPLVEPHDTVYVWATRNDDSKSRYGYVAYTLTDNDTKVKMVDAGHLIWCKDYTQPPGSPHPLAKFDQSHDSTVCTEDPTKDRLNTHGSWTQCGGGCCTVSGSKRWKPGGPTT